MDSRYTIEEFSCEIPVKEYLARFHNPDEVWGYCRACSNYGKQWGCPPFEFDVVERLSKYHHLLLTATKITLLDRSISSCEVNNLLRPERARLEKKLLALEKQSNGLACTYIGECLHCAKGCCTRLEGRPCRHAELVRPSLEAYGFDVAKTMTDIFNIELKWSTKDALPEYLILVCGLFYSNKPQQSMR